MTLREQDLNQRYLRYGPFEVDLEKQLVSKDGRPLKLSGKTYDLLLVLLDCPGEIVTRDTIRNRLWQDSPVDLTSNLNMTVTKLRRELGDSSNNPLYIRTVTSKGYELIVTPGQALTSLQSGEVETPLPGQSEAQIAKRVNVRQLILLVLFGFFFGAALALFIQSYHF